MDFENGMSPVLTIALPTLKSYTPHVSQELTTTSALSVRVSVVVI